MATQMTEREPTSYAELATARKALGALPAADLIRLSKIAQMRSYGLGAYEAEDLLSEAVLRVLDGRRRWPLAVPLVAFLAQVMRSIASEEREKDERFVSSSRFEPALCEPDERPEPPRAIDARDQLDAVLARFAGDAEVLGLIQGYRDGESAAETKARTGMDARAYDAARKRLRRTIDRMKDEGQL